MNPEWIHAGLAAAGILATLLLFVLKARDGQTSADIKIAAEQAKSAALETKAEILDRMAATYMPKAQSERMHAENRDTLKAIQQQIRQHDEWERGAVSRYMPRLEAEPMLKRIQSQLDEQGGKLDTQAKVIGDIQSRITAIEKQGQRRA